MKTWIMHHPCPHASCDEDVELIYEVGRGRDEFFLTTDEAYCGNDHQVPTRVLNAWWAEDVGEYGQHVYGQLEAQRYYHESEGL